MKKFTLLACSFLVASLGWQSMAQVLNQNAAWPNVAWTVGGTYTPAGLLNDPTAAANFTWDDDAAATGSVDVINAESPVIDLTAASGAGETWININGDFVYYELGGDILTIEYWDADATNWITLETFIGNSTTAADFQGCLNMAPYTTATLNIGSFTPTQLSGFKYRINYDDVGGWQWGWCFNAPTIVSSSPPACQAPTALNITNLTATSADLGWTDFNGASLWDIEWDTAGFTPGTGTMVIGTSTNPHNLTGLTANTSYDFYVRADCNPGTSTWGGPFTFFTGYCNPAPSSVDGNGITNVTMGSINNTTVAEANNYGDYSAMITNAQQATTLPIAITFETGFIYDVWVWVDWNDDLDFADAGEEYYLGASLVTNPTTFNGSILIPLTATLGNHRIRIGSSWETQGLGNTAPSFPCYSGTWAAFEDYTLNILTAPTCIAPSALNITNLTATSVDLGWTDNAGVSLWDIEWDTAGFTPGTGTMVVGTTTNPHNLTGLLPITSYDFYVRADCGGGDLSTMTGPFNFTTTCATYVAPFTETFDGTTTPLCWSQSATTGGPWVFGALGAADYAAAIFDDHTANAGNFAWMDFSGGGNDVGVVLETPNIDVSALSATTLTFWLASYNTDNNDSNQLFVEAWNGTAWDIIATIQQDSSLWVEHTFDITASVFAGIAKVRFRAEMDPIGTDFFNNDLLIDDINIDGTVGIDETIDAINLNVYPNPNKGVFTVNIKAVKANQLGIKIMNVQGQVVYTKNNFDNMSNVSEQIDLSNNAEGIYFITITSDKGVKTHKVIVQ